jgi:hypothetical protein
MSTTMEIQLGHDTVSVLVMSGGHCEVIVNGDEDRAFGCKWPALVDGAENDELERRGLSVAGIEHVVACLRRREAAYWMTQGDAGK